MSETFAQARAEIDRLRAELTRRGRALQAIIVRCEEGDKRSDWLPTIASIARDGLAIDQARLPSTQGKPKPFAWFYERASFSEYSNGKMLYGGWKPGLSFDKPDVLHGGKDFRKVTPLFKAFSDVEAKP